MAEITLTKVVSGGGGGGSVTVRQENIVNQSTDTITVGMNGGVLPTDNANIILSGPTGILQQGAGSGNYTINRSGTPNTLVLGSTPFSPINFTLVCIY